MQARLGLKVLGLSALVMSVMAVGTAGVAKAEVGACFGYLPAPLTCFGGLEPEPLLAFENNTGTLLMGVNLEVLCTGAKFVEGGTLGGTGVLLGRVQFEGCISLSKTPTLTKLNSCTPNDPIAGLGRIRTEKIKGLIKLHNGEPVLEISPDIGLLLGKIFLGEECAVSEELIVEGHLVLRDTPVHHISGTGQLVLLKTSKEQFEKHVLSHLIEEHPTLHLMKIGVNSALLDGTAIVTLKTPHNALLWAGHAG